MIRRQVRRARRELAVSTAREVRGHAVVPVDVEGIIRERGITLMERELEQGVYGMCVRKGDRAAIIYDGRGQSPQRLRFTLAHELGHAVLLDDDGYTVDGVGVRYRADDGNIGTRADEAEANYFAAELLMPESEVRSRIDSGGPRWLTERDLRALAHQFQVSVAAMTVRVTSLGYETD